MNKKKERVVIVDDHPMFRERLAQLINHELDMEVCGEADDAEQAIRLIRDTSPNLAIVDITLKGSSGLELIKSIKALSIVVPVLVLSMHDESLYAERALRAGGLRWELPFTGRRHRMHSVPVGCARTSLRRVSALFPRSRG